MKTYLLMVWILLANGACSRQLAPPIQSKSSPKSKDQQTITASPKLSVTLCGNGVIDKNETCDDGNPIGGDGCSPRCKKEIIGFLWNCVVDSSGGIHRRRGGPVPDGYNRALQIGKGVALLDRTPQRIAHCGSYGYAIPKEFEGRIAHMAGSGRSRYLIALTNGELWHMSPNIQAKEPCSDYGLEDPGIVINERKSYRWCREPHAPVPLIDLSLSGYVDQGGAVHYGRLNNYQILSLPPALQLTSNGGSSCVLLATGEVACWGISFRGELGYMAPGPYDVDDHYRARNPPTTFLKFPTPVKKLLNNYALTEGGELWCWGDCGERPFADTGEPEPFWHRMMADDPPVAGGNAKPVGASTMPKSSLLLPEGCKVKDFQGHCVLCEDGCTKCWNNKEELAAAECLEY